jgi:hypothetical protein
MTEDQLRRIAASVGRRRGWDFSRMRETQEPAPWECADVARTYLAADSHALDIGTGGGERFLRLADAFRSGVGIDSSAAMIATAQENLPPALADKISFAVIAAQHLAFAPASFDVILNRHAPGDAAEVARAASWWRPHHAAGRRSQHGEHLRRLRLYARRDVRQRPHTNA